MLSLKRKRSDEFLSSSRFSSDFNFNGTSSVDSATCGFFSTRSSTPSHLPSRTMKRFRDNRPPEEVVYKHTLELLYSAQRRSHTHQPPPTKPTPTPAEPLIQPQAHMQRKSHQRSLHSFWGIPGPRSPSISSAASPVSSSVSLASSTPDLPSSIPETCEDCDAALVDGDDTMMMDIDGYRYGQGLADRICGACRKAVCASCSVREAAVGSDAEAFGWDVLFVLP
ncbi:hypothetical protein VTJ04DRAFT_10620 [Mycothermus thermophilus]|uniref:uncharacterized protein n=1 Tax=Humicola insolens TaxID=85995 RepID=UPI0037433E90